jgi:hypothetical protein
MLLAAVRRSYPKRANPASHAAKLLLDALDVEHELDLL